MSRIHVLWDLDDRDGKDSVKYAKLSLQLVSLAWHEDRKPKGIASLPLDVASHLVC